MQLHVKDTTTSLTEADWETLAKRTEGFSGSDLASCVSDALFEPLREIQTTRFWEITPGRYIPGEIAL